MRASASFPAIVLLALAGCSAETPSTPTDAAGPASPASSTAQPAPKPAPQTSAPVPSSVAPEARLDGFGPLRLGMTTAEAGAAWPGLFDAVADAGARRDCFHVSGALSHFGLMFDGGRFVRYGGANDDVVAPGGGRRGMPEAELQAFYHDALQAAPDRFVRGGRLLSLDASGIAPSRLVFVLRPDGVVNEWRVGLGPQVDYDEGCEGHG